VSALTAFLLVFGCAFGSGVLALAVDVAGPQTLIGRLGRWSSVTALLFGAAVGIWSASAHDPVVVVGSLPSGGGFSAICGVIFLLAAASIAGDTGSSGQGGRAALISFGALFGALAVVSSDLILVLIGAEGAAFCAYALVWGAGTRRSAEAAARYFIQGSVAAGLFILGCAVLISVFTPDASFAGLSAGVAGGPGLVQAAVFGALAVVVALAFKLGAAPMHSWAPDAYEAAPASSASYLAGGAKLAMASALAFTTARFATAGMTQSALGPMTSKLVVCVGSISIASVIIGTTVALTARSYRRMLGYAGVAQVGYALLAIASLKATSAVFFAATYALATTVTFLIAAVAEHIHPAWDGSIEHLAGLGRKRPLVGISLLVAFASLAGVPPLLGFWGKYQVFGSAISSVLVFAENGETTAAIVLAVAIGIGVLGLAVSMACYGKVIYVFFMNGEAVFESQNDKNKGVDGTSDAFDKKVIVAEVVAFGLVIILVALSLVPIFLDPGAVSALFRFS